jgi:hypothetical protein
LNQFNKPFGNGFEIIDKTQTPIQTNNIIKEDNVFTLNNFSPITAQSIKVDTIGKISQTAHPTHDNAIVKKMKIFKTCVMNDDKKGITEIL